MLVVWGRKNSINVQKVMWCVGELGLAHERKDVGGPFGGLDTAEYGALNPNRRVPTIVDGDGTTIWESNAIVRYLAARYGSGSLWPEDASARARADLWLDWMQTTLLPNLAPVFLGLIRTPAEERDMAKIERCARAMGERGASSMRTWRGAASSRPTISPWATSPSAPPAIATMRWTSSARRSPTLRFGTSDCRSASPSAPT